jgi:hypothetical protein
MITCRLICVDDGWNRARLAAAERAAGSGRTGCGERPAPRRASRGSRPCVPALAGRGHGAGWLAVATRTCLILCDRFSCRAPAFQLDVFEIGLQEVRLLAGSCTALWEGSRPGRDDSCESSKMAHTTLRQATLTPDMSGRCPVRLVHSGCLLAGPMPSCFLA